ncbi:RagB/SusD family nutrient uptake outer membrane protein [Mucilaginibacter sabulilitoris]|uniref:RagB/SusD family nutrient uptake outer membrane protein n=1 Tax=Mucilaginibacter sabulilitoris TaxID=1173583 RepID=A0ABZ0TMD3_9SPHI|nr:RagB/SusD family nutrient uptake outer membrane protein [Mucilaginibacter sabulilitoris]WPU94092.1 RagB/SusD family nutrient uptake outer membrane protein [Mucilaginibacter sabulilitoris]
MRNIKRILAITFICVMACSCKKSFLELSPVSNANANNFYKTKADFEVAINSAYATLYVIYAPEEAVSYTEIMSDEGTLYAVAGAQADKWAIRDYTTTASNTLVYQYWQDYYKALFNINNVLDKIQTASLDAAYTNRVKGEMMFLRGLYYYNLVQLFGGVPLVTKVISADESYGILRSPVADVYNQIVADLKFAVDNLPLANAVPAVGRASKGAAETVLGKVYLSLGNKTAATQVLQDVYNSGQYSLLPQYTSLFGANVKNTKESVFEIQYLGGSASNPYSPYWTAFAPVTNGVITKYGGGINQVTDDLYNEYEANDPRRDASVETGYTDAKGNFVKIKFPKKWEDRTAPTSGTQELSNNNFMVLRYADVLLLLSEATGDATYLNQVRARVGLPAFGTAGYPSAQYPTIALAIEHERKVELALEFHRFFDLKRTGRAVAVLTGKGKAVTEQRLVLPIPQYVITQNSKITQNPGY